MKKKFWTVVIAVLVVAVCLSTLVGCDGSARFVKRIGCYDFLYEKYVNVTMSRRLPKTAVWNSDMEAIKYGGSIFELFELMQLDDGYDKTLCNGCILIETTDKGRAYTWGIFSTSVWGDYAGEYNYVLTDMGCAASDVGYDMFFFPIYTMEQPLLRWKDGKHYECDITVEELSEFYIQHGYTVERLGNVLTVVTPTRKRANGDDYRETWDVTFHNDGVGVGNFVTQETIYD